MNTKEAAYKHTLLLCIITILVCFIMKLFGYSGFDIPIIESTLNNNQAVIVLCYGLLYTLNGLLIIMLIVKRRLKIKELVATVTTFVLFYIVGLVITLDYLKFIFEILFMLLISYYATRDSKIIIEALIISGVTILYQFVSLITKGLIIGVANESFINSVIFQIDYYMLMLTSVLYFCKKGVHIYELVYKIFNRSWWKSLAISILPSKRNSEEKCVQQSEEVVFEVGYFVFNIVLFIFQMLLVLSICYFIKNTLINVILIYISFVILRKVFGETYHADSIIKCTTISVILFITATELSLDINISLLSCIFIGIALSYGMHVYYFYDNYIKQNNDITKLSLDELKKKLYFLSDLEINLVYDYWHKDKHTTADDIADKYGYNKMKIYRTIRKIKDNNV